MSSKLVLVTLSPHRNLSFFIEFFQDVVYLKVMFFLRWLLMNFHRFLSSVRVGVIADASLI